MVVSSLTGLTVGPTQLRMVAGAAHVRINSGGNVGIVTTLPTTKLDVAGVIREGVAGGRFYGSPSGNFAGKETVITTADGAGNANDEIWIGPNISGIQGHIQMVASEMVFTVGGNNTFFIQNGGNVGIGTVAPGAKLDVAGGIRPMPAAPGSLCSPLGAQTYNSGTGAPLYCDGSSWTAVGGDGVLSIDVWKCPDTGSCDDGQVVDGSWASTGCLGQVTSVSTCIQRWWNSGGRSCLNNCNYLGKFRAFLNLSPAETFALLYF